MIRHARTRRSSTAGFTLIELLVVISIIGILVGISSRRNNLSIERSRDAAVMIQLSGIRTAIHQYSLDNGGRFPETLEALFPNYLAKPVQTWTGSRASGIISFEPMTGSIRLFNAGGQSPENTPDCRGRPYAEY